MLIGRHDQVLSDQEWRDLLSDLDFGQLVAAGRDRDKPVIVPVHFIFDGQETIELHLDRRNPVWDLLEEDPSAAFTVVDAHVFVPSVWNCESGREPEWSAPTSYYAAVQLFGPVEIVDAPEELALLLQRQMTRMQPEGGYAPIDPGDNPFGRMLPAIRGLRLRAREVRAKFKFGGNRSPHLAGEIADRLAARGTPGDQRARRHLLRRQAATAPSSPTRSAQE